MAASRKGGASSPASLPAVPLLLSGVRSVSDLSTGEGKRQGEHRPPVGDVGVDYTISCVMIVSSGRSAQSLALPCFSAFTGVTRLMRGGGFYAFTQPQEPIVKFL